MQKIRSAVFSVSILLAWASPSFGQQAEGDAVVPAENTEAEAPRIEKGTKLYDAETVAELFEETKAENERRAEQVAPHFNAENLEIIELAPIQVDPYHIRNFNELLYKIDPQPRKRLQRLAELDPAAAADIHVAQRSTERFFAGEYDHRDMNAGQTANVDFREVGSSIAEAVKRAKNALREKKATDNQEAIPVEAK